MDHFMEDIIMRNHNSFYHNRDIKTPDGAWLRCNDSIVSSLKSPENDESETAYVLFYHLKP